MSNFGIRHRVLMLAVVPTITISILLTAFFTSTRLHDLEQTFKDRGEAIALKLASGTDYGVYTRSPELLKALGQTTLQEYGLQSISFYTQQGQEITHVGQCMHSGISESIINSLPSPEPGSLPQIFTEETTHLLSLTVPITLFQEKKSSVRGNEQKETLVGWIKVELDTAPVKIREYEMLFHTGLIVFLGLGISGLHAFQMGRNVTRPILELAQAVEQIRLGDLNTRIRKSAYKELRILESGFNTMAQALQNAHRELQNKIDRATLTLRKTLETIEVQNLELEIARRAAEKANQVKSEFLADMSHEIRTPLNSVIGFLTLLKTSPLTEKQTHYLKTIEKSAQTLLSIINNILDFTKIEAGKLNIDHSLTDIRECVEEVILLFTPEAEAKGLKILNKIDPAIPLYCISDPLRLKQILTNLVNNALKFTDRGSIHIQLYMKESSLKESLIKIEVKDTGNGLSKDEKSKLFKPFSQVKRQSGGTGLGLVICKKLVEQLGGEIGVFDNTPKGSVFWFTVKIKMTDALPALELSKTNTDGVFKVYDGASPFHILAVDDNADNLELIQTILKDMGFSVTTASSGQKAIAAFLKNKFDLILMDIRMPDINGIMATARIRQIEADESLSHTPIIALTAHALYSEKKALLSADIDGILLKPILIPDLKALILKWTKRDNVVFDSELALQLAGNNQALAKDLFERFVKELPKTKALMQEAFNKEDFETLKDVVHKCHGGAAYIGVPALKSALHQLESFLNSHNINPNPSLFTDKFNLTLKEINRVLQISLDSVKTLT